MNFRDLFNKLAPPIKKLASPVVFLAASLATFIPALHPLNPLVAIGGFGLSAAAGAFTIMTAKGSDLGKLANTFMLTANAALTLNGLLMYQNGITSGDTNLATAGLYLAGANSLFYGVANLATRMDRMRPETHAIFSMGAGTLIAGAGLSLRDPVLTAVGVGFVTEAALRMPQTSVPGQRQPVPARVRI